MVDLKIRNESLLNKWLWRYGNEPDCLWEKIIVAKYSYDHTTLTPKPLLRNGSSWIWRSITKAANNVSGHYSTHQRLILGDGKAIDFWDDHWTNFPSLKQAFPRVFNVAVKKQGKVSDFGVKTEGKWEWKIEMRRPLFEYEKTIWDDFIDTLNRASNRFLAKDSVRWLEDSSGLYSPKSFCAIAATDGYQEDSVWKHVWAGLAPPKVEAFIWKAMLNRIPSKIELSKRGVSNVVSTTCVFCGKEEETSIHILCHCDLSWRIWQKWCANWNIHLILPSNLRTFLLSWNNQYIQSNVKPLWALSFFGIAWTLWLFRNDAIFTSKRTVENQMYDTAVMRIGFWAKSIWPTAFLSISEFTQCPNSFSLIKVMNHSKKNAIWIKPTIGFLKFNVDAAVQGSYGTAGIGGILRNHEGRILAVFSKKIGLADPSFAELCGILEACKSFSKSVWNASSNLIIASDNMLAINWLHCPSNAPSCFSEIVQEICRFKDKFN